MNYNFLLRLYGRCGRLETWRWPIICIVHARYGRPCRIWKFIWYSRWYRWFTICCSITTTIPVLYSPDVVTTIPDEFYYTLIDRYRCIRCSRPAFVPWWVIGIVDDWLLTCSIQYSCSLPLNILTVVLFPSLVLPLFRPTVPLGYCDIRWLSIHCPLFPVVTWNYHIDTLMALFLICRRRPVFWVVGLISCRYYIRYYLEVIRSIVEFCSEWKGDTLQLPTSMIWVFPVLTLIGDLRDVDLTYHFWCDHPTIIPHWEAVPVVPGSYYVILLLFFVTFDGDDIIERWYDGDGVVTRYGIQAIFYQRVTVVPVRDLLKNSFSVSGGRLTESCPQPGLWWLICGAIDVVVTEPYVCHTVFIHGRYYTW